jgi:CubicO group peptidase (beta-lactamase class C family)
MCWWFPLLISSAVTASSLDAATNVDTKAIDAIMREAIKAWHVPGAALAIVRHGKVAYLHGYGVKEWGGEEQVTPDTLFPIASCTKAFTTTAMAMLVDQGKVHWDDPVRKHVGFFRLADPLADANVTLRDLVTHRTGLASHDLLWYRSPWSRDEIIRRIGRAPLQNSFRSTFQYQSTMFSAAGVAVESASKTPWEEIIQKRIFEPLEMKSSTFTTTAAVKAADYASPHRRNSRGEPEVIHRYSMTSPDPAGSIHSNARDLSQWVLFQLGDGSFRGKRLVSAKNLAETHSPQMVIRMEGPARDMNPHTHQMNYGMGWVLQDYRGKFLVSHAGAIDGFRAHITLVPDAKLGLVLLNNLHGTQMNLAAGNQIVDLLLGLPGEDWNKFYAGLVRRGEAAAQAKIRERDAKRHLGTKPSCEAGAYVGTYEDPVYGTATVGLANGALVWQWNSFNAPLVHFEFDTFIVANDRLGRPQISFLLGPSGEVTAMKFQDVLPAEFKKVKPKGSD